MRRIIESGVYRHFKGKYYRVICVGQHTETSEQFVVYQELYGNNKIYVRPLEMFASEVDKDKYPDAKQPYIFEWVYRSAEPLHGILDGDTYRPMTKEEYDKLIRPYLNPVVLCG